MTVVPAEWSPHRALWIGFPSHGELWLDNLEPAQIEVVALAQALAGPGGERVRLLVCGDAAEARARQLLIGTPGVEIVRGDFGDIWLRDTGPIFRGDGQAAQFQFNGWGGKYMLDGDQEVAGQLAAASGVPLIDFDFVLEGGAIDHDGLGTILTTRQCMLNPNRNPGMTEAQIEAALANALNVRKVLWLDEGLVGDHTDGHVDNLARFVGPALVACPVAQSRSDPNAQIYDLAARALSGMTNVRGTPLQVLRLPSPGAVLDDDGEIMAASHMNFLIANKAVITPIYHAATGALAVEALQALFPERKVIGLPSRAILSGGGSFHCISQQEPAL